MIKYFIKTLYNNYKHRKSSLSYETNTTSHSLFIFWKSHNTLKNDDTDIDGIDNANYTWQ